MKYNQPVSQSEVLARIEAMSFGEKRQYRIDWDLWLIKEAERGYCGYGFREWLHQRTERLLHEEADKHNANYY